MFAAAAVLSALSAAALAAALPSLPAHPSAGFGMLRQALANRRLMVGVLGVVLVAFGNFAAYPYIRLAIDEAAPSASAAWLLLAWGVGGLVGNLLAGRYSSSLRLVAGAAPLLLGISLLVTALVDLSWLLVVAVVLWGLAFNMVPVATQLWVTRVESERAESAMSLQVTAFQLAITLGSAAGGVLVDGYGVTSALVAGAVFAAAAGAVFSSMRVPRA